MGGRYVGFDSLHAYKSSGYTDTDDRSAPNITQTSIHTISTWFPKNYSDIDVVTADYDNGHITYGRVLKLIPF